MPSLTPLAKARRRLILKWRRFLGICVNCGTEAYGNALCDRCQEKSTERTRKKRINSKAYGMCQECGKNKANSDGYRCDGCIELMRARKPDRICEIESCINIAKLHNVLCTDCLADREAERQSSKVYFVECPDCNKLFTQKHKGIIRCETCKVIHLRLLNKMHKRKVNGLKIITKTCAHYKCDNTFNTYYERKITCSELCSKRVMQRKKHQKERAKKGRDESDKRYIENVDLKVLFFRDGGRCQICNRKLNLTRPNNHPLQATHDHITPWANDGENSYKNAQLACRRCNSIKSNGVAEGGEQLLLFGL